MKNKKTGLRAVLSLREMGAHSFYLMVATLILSAISIIPARAETITIGSGSGVVWEGMPFSGQLSGLTATAGYGNISLVAIGTSANICDFQGAAMATVNGIRGLKLAQGVILVPRMSVNGNFTRASGELATFGGTIGLPSSDMYMDNGQNMRKTNTVGPWCFSPKGNWNSTQQDSNFYSTTVPRVINYAGTWVVLADGTQTSVDNISLPPFYFGSYTGIAAGSLSSQILPTTINMRVSTLACTIATTTAINFNSVRRNSQSGAELAQLSYPLNTSCVQPIDMISANINLQFRAISGHYNSTPSWLALTQGGGYITGEIDNGVTSSGSCTGSGGIPFNNTQLKVGSITSSENSMTTNNQVIWRLCSGGSDLPVGAVDASAEMIVTFN